MTLRILLVESETEDVLFLRDVLEEMEGSEFWNGWLHLDTLDAPTWGFAEALLATEPVDVLLLSLNLSDSTGADTFRRARAAAPQVPVVLLIEEADVDLAERLIRDGAQDFLIKRHVDCEPLAHAIRTAVDRHRLLAAAEASTLTDSLTGLLNRSSFCRFAGRDRKLAAHLGGRLAILVLEPHQARGASRDAATLDLVMVEGADLLRSLAGPTDLVARIGPACFAISLLETGDEALAQAIVRFQSAAFAIQPLRLDQQEALEAILDHAATNRNAAPIHIDRRASAHAS